MKEDAHLDTPELGDFVIFMDFHFGVSVEIEGEITHIYKTTKKANVRSLSGAQFRSVPFTDITVLSKAA